MSTVATMAISLSNQTSLSATRSAFDQKKPAFRVFEHILVSHGGHFRV